MHPWRTRLTRWFTPLARRCPLSPNAISALACGWTLAGALALAGGAHRPVLFLVAVPLIAVGGLLDAFDGIVAREQHKISRLGDFLDHLYDRIADLFLLMGWGFGAGLRAELIYIALIAVALNGYAGTQLEATFGVRTYEGTGRGEFLLALIVLPLAAFSLAKTGLLEHRFGGMTPLEWATAVLTFAAFSATLGRVGTARRLNREKVSP